MSKYKITVKDEKEADYFNFESQIDSPVKVELISEWEEKTVFSVDISEWYEKAFFQGLNEKYKVIEIEKL